MTLCGASVKLVEIPQWFEVTIGQAAWSGSWRCSAPAAAGASSESLTPGSPEGFGPEPLLPHAAPKAFLETNGADCHQGSRAD